MRCKPALIGVPLAALVLTACGSSTHSSSATTAAPSTSTATGGPTLTKRLPGTSVGSKASLATLHQLPRVHSGTRPQVVGVAGLSLPQKLQTFASDVANLWSLEFARATSQLPPATVNLIDQTPAVCGSSQVSTADPPEYCPADGSVDLPLGYLGANIAPLGDGALLLVVSDMFGYHVENALGAFNAGLSGPALEELDACLSGVYFVYAFSQKHLQPGDEASVNKLLAAEASAAGTPAGPGVVTAMDLTNAFNKGILGNGNYRVCLPQGGGTTTTP